MAGSPGALSAGVPRGRAAWLLLLGVLLVATNLRAVLAAVGPLLPEIGTDLGLTASAQGVLVALPLVAFATVSPLVHLISKRVGIEKAVLLALIFLGGATVVRSIPTQSVGNASLWVGTFVIGGAIAIGNVLLPAVVRKDFPDRIAAVTGYYIAIQSLAGASASALAVPLAVEFGSWRAALAVWGVLIIVALAAWAPHLRRPSGPTPAMEASGISTLRVDSVWRSGDSWLIALYFGLQSSIFYIQMSWLPTIEQDLGFAPTVAGYHLAGYLVLGIAANFAAPWFMSWGSNLRPALVGVAAVMGMSIFAFIVWPDLAAVWVGLSGLAAGAAMVFSLSLISLRAGSGTAASQLSSMVQSIAYSGVVVLLISEGMIRESGVTGLPLLWLPLLLAAIQLVTGIFLGARPWAAHSSTASSLAER